MLVPFGYDEPDPHTSPVTPVMECREAQEVAELARDLMDLSGRMSDFVRAHWRPCKCLFCSVYPHAVVFMNTLAVSCEMQSDFLDHIRPPTAQEFREIQEIHGSPHVVAAGGSDGR